MEYLVLAGTDLRTALSQALGAYAPFFWGVIAPITLGLLWLGCLYTLKAVWRRKRGEEGELGTVLPKLFFTALLSAVILGSGTALEYLLLGDGLVHARILGGVVDLIGAPSVPNPPPIPGSTGGLG
jgi:hypothetical protein